jgi:hypothetical protein
MSPEQEFWQAFAYDPGADRWLLAEGTSPMDVLDVCQRKSDADRVAVAAVILPSPLQRLARWLRPATVWAQARLRR